MKKKLLTLLTLLVVCVTGTWAQTLTPALPTTTLELPTIPTEGWKGTVTPTYYKAENSSVYVFCPYELYQSVSNLTWTTQNSGGSSGSSVSAIAPFPASSVFTGFKAASLNETSKGPYAYRVKNCIAAYALVKSGSDKKRTITLAAYEINTGTVVSEATASKTYEANSDGVMTINGLDASKEYYIKVSQVGSGTGGSSTGNSTFYMIAFEIPAGPEITTQPQSASYMTGQTISALTVAATASAGDLSYQWYSCDDANKTNAAEISGATSASYTPTAAGFYYVTVTDDNGSVDSDVAEISISAAEAPTIDVTGAPAGDVAKGTAVTLTATITGNPNPTIQWYSNTTASNTGGTAIENETNATYSPSTTATGTFYFYAVASNSQGDVPSAVQTIVVKEQVATPTFDPNGAYFQESQEVTLDCTTAGATIQYSIDNGATWTDYTAAFTLTATTTVQAKAIKDGYIDSEVATATFTLVTLDEQTDVTGATTWDWSTVTNDSNIDFGDEGAGSLRNVDVLFSNIPKYGKTAVTAPAAFDQTALLMNGQRPYANANGSKHCQVNYLKFNTTVSGWVTVEYSNTGNNAARTVNVNGTKGSKSVANNTDYVSETFAVSAGTVTIKGVQVSDDADKMLRIRKVTFTPPVTVTATKQYSTYCSTFDLDFENVENLEAYVVSELTSSSAKITKVEKVPAGTGLILKKTANVGEATDFTVPIATTNASVGTNYLVGVTADKSMDNEANAYILSNGKFYKCSGGTLAAGKAYLDATGTAWAGSTAPSFSIEGDGDATGIRSIDNGQLIMDNVIYDLNGRRIENPTKGVYIMNGKKVVIK